MLHKQGKGKMDMNDSRTMGTRTELNAVLFPPYFQSRNFCGDSGITEGAAIFGSRLFVLLHSFSSLLSMWAGRYFLSRWACCITSAIQPPSDFPPHFFIFHEYFCAIYY